MILAVVLLFVWKSIEVHAGIMTPDLQTAIQAADPGREIQVIVTLSDRVDIRLFKETQKSRRRANILKALRNNAEFSQRDLKALLRRRRARRMKSLWLINGIAVTARADVIRELARLPQVARIRLDRAIPLSEVIPTVAAVAGWNIDAVRATELWDLGYRGQGVVVATMDSGVDLNHPDLLNRWRGGTNSWFDPNGEHDTPHDADGHGTQVMGIMVGGDAGGTAIGVAPDAEWIAVKIFNDAGLTLLSAIHEGFQWVLDPDGNPDTDDAPDMVNNSWGLMDDVDQCIEEFHPDIQTLKAAGIAVVFAAGNGGPNPSTSISPANNLEGFAAGAIDEFFEVAPFSSRGPSICDDAIYPEVAAPGVSVYTADLSFGGLPDRYTSVSGTSFAAAHTAGTMALLLSAFPDLSVPELEESLKNGALDLGDNGPDNDYGYGVIDALEAYNFLLNCTPPLVDFTADPNPTAVGDLVNFTSTVSGGTPPYAYAWDVNGDGVTDCDTPDCVYAYTDFYNGNVKLVVTDSQACAAFVVHPMGVGVRILGSVLDSDESPVPDAEISVVEHPEVNDISRAPDGDFVLSGVQPDERIHILVQGPQGSPIDYIETYSPYFTLPATDITQDALIIQRSDVEPILQTFNPDQSLGIVIGAVVDQTGEGVAGATVTVTNMNNNPINASIGYLDANDAWNPAQTGTSTNGSYVIYDIEEVGKDIKIIAEREGWDFAAVEAKVYPYFASPEKVTVAPVTGETGASGGVSALSGGGGSGGCLISTAVSGSLFASGASILLLVLGGIGLGVLLTERDHNRKKASIGLGGS